MNNPFDLEIQQLRIRHGLKPQPQNYPRTVRAVSLSDTAYQTLQMLAVEFGHTRHLGAGNVSALLECIGQGIYTVQLNQALITPD